MTILIMMLSHIVVLIVVTLTIGSEWHSCEAATPIVLWHGMGDSCCLPISLGRFKKFLEDEIEGVYVKSLMIGDSVTEDMSNGFFLTPNKQIENVCQQLYDDPELQGGFNAIGFSQGSQFLRGTLQRCGHLIPPMINLISLGGQHQGVYGIPNCDPTSLSCDLIRRNLNKAAYEEQVQDFLVQATYWHNPLDEDLYREKSKFLSDINNEKSINETYIRNLMSLNKFIMVKFNNDTMVVPVDSQLFGFYKPGQSKIVLSLEESDLYIEDRLGLQKMNKEGKIVFLDVNGNHLEFSNDWFKENILIPYLL